MFIQIKAILNSHMFYFNFTQFSKALRSQYQLMIKKLSETGTSKGELNEKISSTTIEQGKMLFLAFNSLFDSVDSSVKEVRTSLKSCQVPETWSVGIDSIAGIYLFFDFGLGVFRNLIILMFGLLVAIYE